jgi:Tol biopolymer transport system component
MKLFVIILATCVLTLQGCQKDSRIIDPNECPSRSELFDMFSYLEGTEFYGDIVYTSDSGYAFVNYVPGNDDELIFYYSGFLTNYDSNFVKYNLLTKEMSNILVEPDFFVLYSVSSTGWLLFTRPDYQIWKVKFDGDSLTQVTFNGYNGHCAWSPDGERIIYNQNEPIATHNIIIADKNGNFQFSVDSGYSMRRPTWSPDGRYIAFTKLDGYYSDIDFIDTTTWEIQNLITGDYVYEDQIKSMDFFPDGKHLLWATETELNKTNIETKVTELLATTCNSWAFDEVSVSDDGQTIIVKKLILTYFDSRHLFRSSQLFMFDANGNEIKEIVL